MKKNSLTQNDSNFLEYLLYEKNILSPKKATIAALAIIIIIIFIFNFFKVKLEDFDYYEGNDLEPEYMREFLLLVGYDSEYLESLKDEQLTTAFNEVYLKTKGQTAGNSKHSEFEETQSYLLKQDYYLLASKGDFNAIIKDFEDKKEKYYFSEPYNKDIITIYNDAYYLNMIINNNNASTDRFIETLKNIKDPQMLLYGTLLSPEEARRDILEDKISLSPTVVNENIRVNNVKSGYIASAKTSDSMKDDERFTEMANFIGEGSNILYRINFSIYGSELNAYLYKNLSQQKTYFYGIYSPKGSESQYLTVQDFINMEYNSMQDTSNISYENEGFAIDNSNELIIDNSNELVIDDSDDKPTN